MKFRRAKEKAKFNTAGLLVLYVILFSVILLLGTVVLSMGFGALWSTPRVESENGFSWLTQWRPAVVLFGGSSLVAYVFDRWRTTGGAAVAQRLGGRLIRQSTQTREERKVLNVAEEMALAAAMPVPPLYIIEDAAINAFAAGERPSDAVIGVTRGAIQTLSRSELQGVLGHELSHIKNGDIRLNMRLSSLIVSIEVFWILGDYILSRPVWTRLNSRDSHAFWLVMGMALALYVIGSVGCLAARVLRSSVSRQREFLADAGAVEFTRDPDAVANALIRVLAESAPSTVDHPSTQGVAHMFFLDAVGSAFFDSSWLNTHPPLEDRIRRLTPRWDGKLPSARASGNTYTRGEGSQLNEVASFSGATDSAVSVEPLMEHGSDPLSSVQDDLHDSYGAMVLMCGLLVDDTPLIQAKQFKALNAQSVAPGVVRDIFSRRQVLRQIEDRYWLRMIEIAMPALKAMSKNQYLQLIRTLDTLIDADHEVTFREWCLRCLISHYLSAIHEPRAHRPFSYRPVERLVEPFTLVVRAMAVHDTNDNSDAAMHAAFELLGLEPPDSQHLTKESPSIDKFQQALGYLAEANLTIRNNIMAALEVLVLNDNIVSADEIQMLHAIGLTIDAPLPVAIEQKMSDVTGIGIAA